LTTTDERLNAALATLRKAIIEEVQLGHANNVARVEALEWEVRSLWEENAEIRRVWHELAKEVKGSSEGKDD
jgi:hypothetical protein